MVDNFSQDGSEDKLRELFPEIEITQTEKNLGYTGGVNIGIQQGMKRNAEFILLLNEDTLATPDFLERLVKAMEENPNAAAACGTIYYHPEISRLWYAGGKLIPWRGLAIHYTSLPSLKNGLQSSYQKVSFVTGCMTLIRCSLLDKIGLKDERFFMSLEDIEYSARIINLGYELLYVPEAVIYHRIPVNYESMFNLYYSVRNRLLLIDTAFPSIMKHIAKVYFLLVIFGKLIFWKFIKPQKFKAARSGLKDYFSKCFNEGRGVAEFSK
jgi:GT2 family glycosyltransferase